MATWNVTVKRSSTGNEHKRHSANDSSVRDCVMTVVSEIV